MILPLRTDSRTKRRRELRSILGTEKTVRKQRFPWVRQVRAYVVAHYKMLLSIAVIVACVYAHIYYFNKLTIMQQQVNNLRGQIRGGLQMRENIIPSLTVAMNRFIRGITDRSFDPEQLRRIKKLVLKHEGIKALSRLRGRKIGQSEWIDIDAQFDPEISVSKVKKIVSNIKTEIMNKFEGIGNVVIVPHAAEAELREI